MDSGALHWSEKAPRILQGAKIVSVKEDKAAEKK